MPGLRTCRCTNVRSRRRSRAQRYRCDGSCALGPRMTLPARTTCSRMWPRSSSARRARGALHRGEPARGRDGRPSRPHPLRAEHPPHHGRADVRCHRRKRRLLRQPERGGSHRSARLRRWPGRPAGRAHAPVSPLVRGAPRMESARSESGEARVPPPHRHRRHRRTGVERVRPTDAVDHHQRLVHVRAEPGKLGRAASARGRRRARDHRPLSERVDAYDSLPSGIFDSGGHNGGFATLPMQANCVNTGVGYPLSAGAGSGLRCCGRRRSRPAPTSGL